MTAPFDPNPQFAEYAHPERLVSASWLSARLGTPGLRVVESDEDTLLYDIGHIPGAVRIDWRRDLNDAVVRDYISGEAFAELMRSKGISRDDTVVIYGDKSNWWASFTLWVFELFGHEDVRLLNGGRDAWMAEERDTSFVVPEYPRSEYPVIERDDAPFRAFAAEVKQNIGITPLLDVRTLEEYTGERSNMEGYPEEGVMRGGHIPTAMHIPWNLAVHPNSRFRSRAELEDIYAEVADDSIVYCRVGDRSAHTWFVLKYLLGRENIRNYDGSWVEWGNMVRMPIAVGPTPGTLSSN
ncbi:sulfurtransferase [Corynebacterium canis]|uniref:thiosulfate sulfurtransferase n=1 Tax=Corynebacterium canis TaxID=679663 RepID=A0A5C5UCM3_9CORY|nr:sulfurtransferase [Corynebacterium canis]TWT24201.1 sulfurtransferase [Corynebacterium canis]WJY74408.1 Putative thiosulfate sulfurtransferase SseA [Corynebacterium canis]